MAGYSWDLYELRDNIKKIESLLEKEKNPHKREIMIGTIQQYHYMINSVILHKSSDCENNDNIQSIADFLEPILENATKYDAKLVDLLTSTYPIIKDFVQTDDTQYIVCKNNDKLVEDTNGFLKQILTKPQYQRLQQEILENPRYLHIQYSPTNVNGSTFIDSILRKKYILLNRHNEPIDVSAISHEHFHFIFNDFNAYKIFNSNLRYSRELEGSFANFLTIEDLKDNNPEIAQQLSEDFLLYYQIRVICLLILKCYDISSIEKYKFDSGKFYNLLGSHGFNKRLDLETVKDYFGSEDLDNFLSYNLSYLASLDLMKIYENDPEFAFYLLEKIRTLRKSNDVLKVFRKNHITFMDDGFENLKQYVKKIERQD